MASERYELIFLAGPTRTDGFTNPRRGGSSRGIPVRDRLAHGAYLRERLEQTWTKAEEIRQRQAVVHVERQGAYIEFVGEPGFDLAIQSLEDLRLGIRLSNVRTEADGESQRTLATVYVPHDKRAHFLKKIQAYETEVTTRGNRPKNASLVNSISDIRLAVLESFWRTDERSLIPDKSPEKVEVWLSSDTDEVVSHFESLLRALELESEEGVLKFPERAVKLIHANRDQLTRLVEASDDIAEFRLAKQVASFFLEMENREQSNLVKDLLARCKYDHDTDVTVCILDAGVNNGHSLIRPVLSDSDLHTVREEWGGHDHDGHGTLMAGVATYGDLLPLLGRNVTVRILHCLESAKILPPPPETNPKRLWGFFTAQGISRAEISQPQRKRIVCMAVTAIDDRDRGRPSSWSGMIDELASGYADDHHRLIVLSAGNVDDPANWRNYPDDNLTNQVHDPGQAWNALTVGAYTEKTQLTDPMLKFYTSVAPSGGLSPYSTTSLTWPPRKWPIKPEVVFEGGNVACGSNDSILNSDDLNLLSTYHDPQVAQFAVFNATSAACAQAAWTAAQIQARYPAAWPETIRALIVHSANWTDAMKGQFLRDDTKGSHARLLRICGYGVPSLERALFCASNSVTLISQSILQPFDKNGDRLVTRDMHFYDLPWPTDVLSELAEIKVTMRVTLSYFIEPGPGEIGWDNRYRYASHGLRFDVNGPGESHSDFVRRINRQARDDGQHPGTEGSQQNWLIGEARNVGSLHSDLWRGRAADLASSNMIAIYPTVGWWRERAHLQRWNRQCRYSLVVTIHAPEQQVDIYTPVAIQVGLAVPVAITIDKE